MSDSTAILIFAQPAAVEATRKRVAGRPPVGRQVLTRLTERISQTAAATQLPVLHSAELITHRGSFGQQFTEALRITFALGYERVVIVGNDCPALTTAHLTQAADQLRHTPVVLGPDRRGGLYLFGLSRAVFEQVSLLGLPWQTARLSQAVRRCCTAWSVTRLPRLGDINNRADLQQYGSAAPTLLPFLTSLLQLGTHTSSPTSQLPCVRLADVPVGTGSLRAPPARYRVATLA